MSANTVAAGAGDRQRRWQALIALSLGALMVVLDTTVVNVALPSIREDLDFTEKSLIWIVNAYMLTFAGSLLLSGRLGDLYGHRRLFLIGIFLFAITSLACGLANTPGLLIAARTAQGIGGAIVDTVALSLIVDMFTGRAERAKAMGIYGFVCASGGSIGLVLGGALTSVLNWHWIFLVNLPFGAAVYALCRSGLPKPVVKRVDYQPDFWGASTVTASLMLMTYAIANGSEASWASSQTLTLLASSIVLLVAFLIIEVRTPTPLMPLGILRRRNFAVSNAVCALWAAACCGWFFFSALYMQLVLGYGPMQFGLAFLPVSIIVATFSLGVTEKLVTRLGIRGPLGMGMLLSTVGFALFARAPVDGRFMTDILPSMILVGLGAGIAWNPLLLAAMSDARPSESGLASGILNTVYLMGGALGLAILTSFSAARTSSLLASGATTAVALTGGYQAAVLLTSVCAASAALLAFAFLRTEVPTPAHEHAAPRATDTL
jgi:EmrB/QacA subfamily drug resistance transporter